MKIRIARNAKAVIAGLGTTVTALNAAIADNVVDMNETASLVSTATFAALTIYGVWRTPNRG